MRVFIVLMTIGTILTFAACKSTELTTQIANENAFFIKKKDALLFFNQSQQDWTPYETEVDTATKAKYITQLDTSFWYITDYGFKDYYTKEDYYNSFHFVHLNDDEHLDLVFEGWGGGEANVVRFYLNENGIMKLFFEGYQQLYDLQFEGTKQLKSFNILDFGCCSPFDIKMQHYTINNNKSVALEWGVTCLSALTKPKYFFQKAKRIKVAKPSVDMRYEPLIAPEDQLGYSGPLDLVGNKTALYHKGQKGLAYAEERDSAGNVWWLVEMEVQDTFEFNEIHQYADQKYPILGWINRNDLK